MLTTVMTPSWTLSKGNNIDTAYLLCETGIYIRQIRNVYSIYLYLGNRTKRNVYYNARNLCIDRVCLPVRGWPKAVWKIKGRKTHNMISKISKVHFLIFTSMVDPGIVWLSHCDKNLIEDIPFLWICLQYTSGKLIWKRLQSRHVFFRETFSLGLILRLCFHSLILQMSYWG